MPSILVVYYSRSGHTRKIATKVAAILKAELQEIQEPTDRQGWTGYLRSGIEVLREQAVPILPLSQEPTAYDLVVVGTPVWMGHLSSPVRAFLQQGSACKALAFFCTMGGSSPGHTFDDMTACAGRKSLATLAVSEREFGGDAYLPKLEAFVSELQTLLSSTAQEEAQAVAS